MIIKTKDNTQIAFDDYELERIKREAYLLGYYELTELELPYFELYEPDGFESILNGTDIFGNKMYCNIQEPKIVSLNQINITDDQIAELKEAVYQFMGSKLENIILPKLGKENDIDSLDNFIRRYLSSIVITPEEAITIANSFITIRKPIYKSPLIQNPNLRWGFEYMPPEDVQDCLKQSFELVNISRKRYVVSCLKATYPFLVTLIDQLQKKEEKTLVYKVTPQDKEQQFNELLAYCYNIDNTEDINKFDSTKLHELIDRLLKSYKIIDNDIMTLKLLPKQ